MTPTDDTARAHLQAGIAAERATGWRDAIAAYEQCLSEAAPGSVDEADVLTRLGRCYWNVSEARTAWRTLRRAISLYQQRGDGVGQARATVEILRIWGPPERHREMADAALEALGDADPYLRARLLLRGDDDDPRFAEAIAIAQRHGFDDVLAVGKERAAWRATDAGRLDESNALREEIHGAFARAGAYDWAAGALRGAGFSTISYGRLDEGYALAERSFTYAMSMHMAFQAQLALMDMAGVPYARRQFERCEDVLARFPDATDFRADLFRMWMAEERADSETALRFMVDPARGGNVPTAMGQIHAASAGILYRLGKLDAAREAMQAWDAVPRSGWDEEEYAWEGTALVECLAAEADDALIRKVQAAFDIIDGRSQVPPRFSTLQGRALAPLRGAVLARLGRRDEARDAYTDGLAWCEQQGCTRDADACRAGLGSLA